MLTLVFAIVVTQGGPPPPGPPGLPPIATAQKQLAPTALETARLYFVRGDLTNAREWAERGLKREGKTCRPLLKHLAEYGFLAGKWEELSLDEARQLLELDARISPKSRGRLTQPIEDRYVTGPLKRARGWAEQGAALEAVRFVDDVLVVDPKNVEAKALRKLLVELADAGLALDAGVASGRDGGR